MATPGERTAAADRRAPHPTGDESTGGRLSRRDVLRAGAVAGVGAAAGCAGYPGSNGDESGFQEGFEDGLGEWEGDAAIGPDVDVGEFEWELDVSGDEAATGERSLRIWNEGDYDDGVTWGVHPVEVAAGERYQISVTAQLWSLSESFNTIRNVVMRLGPEAPEVEEDFPDPGVNTTALGETPYGGLREPLWLAEGWREYAFEWTTPELSTDTLYVAVGTAVVWETEATHYVDDVEIDVESR